ncbi:uncharacterized protein MAM_00226 [Metarhizium album ARSEF 1941]|uniref:Homeodomain-like protein n=1 Tax=Metarhizium album (strain ARSEF 1941) TaxID=1081103 RepID=A0A0B2X6X7_METAS|nr:uncharacterized protein MAM_00226 [Metarhizium album ARSEF 1941]KHO01225.1 hypothetical protein MAM_00226 [Metarhizium album ARSEF 1941]
MSRTQALQLQSVYTPIKDAMQRRENGVTKNRKTPLTGSGRAWREDEEAYLVQTRLQKMPYKHIAAHLNKTELACRLHYHQLSHGSTRRKRTASCSSGSSDPSPSRPATYSSPGLRGEARSLSPPMAAASYLPKLLNSDMKLSRIMSGETSPRLPAILPKPEGVPHPHGGEVLPRHAIMTPEQHNEPLPSVMNMRHYRSPPYGPPVPPLRLDTGRLSPPSASVPVHTAAHVDLGRLRAIYEARKSAFWASIVEEYGMNASAAALEQAWKTGACCQHSESSPMTPVASPDKDGSAGYRMKGQDKTRISSILDDDTDRRFR